MSRREVVVGGDRVVVAARLLLAAPHDERPEHVGRVERLGRARDARRRVAPPGGREGGGEAEAKRGVSGLLLGLSEESRNVGGRDGGGSGRASARPDQGHQEEQILPLTHRRDFFFAAFRFAAAAAPPPPPAPRRLGGCGGLLPPLGFGGPPPSARSRSPPSGAICPRRTAYRTSPFGPSRVYSATPAGG